VCVECLFLRTPSRGPRLPSPLQDSSGVRQKGGLPGPPPVVPDPESIAAQAAYTEALLPRSAPACHGQRVCLLCVSMTAVPMTKLFAWGGGG
jgi:hypothetical protein